MVQVKWTRNALGDLKDIFDYISKDSFRYAQRQVLKIKERVQVLKQFPQVGKIVEEFRREDVLEIIEGSYRIIYLMKSSSEIHIITIHHSARDLAKRSIKLSE